MQLPYDNRLAASVGRISEAPRAYPPGHMRKGWVLLALVAGLACQGGGAGSSDGSTPTGGVGGGTTGGQDGPMNVDPGTCPFSQAGTACAAGANCTFTSDCLARRCDCSDGR